MEKRYYNFEDFFSLYMRGASVKDKSEAEIYFLKDRVYKIFNSTFADRKEENIEDIGKLDERYITLPDTKIYLDDEYYGYVMNNAGLDIAEYLVKNDTTFDERREILMKAKEGILYLTNLGLIHGDISLTNILYDGEMVRIGDINSLTKRGEEARLNYLSRRWIEAFNDYHLVDTLGFNLITYLLLNHKQEEFREIITDERINPRTYRMKVLAKENEVFDPNIWDNYEEKLLRGNRLVLQNKEIDPKIMLIDYLK